MNWVEMANTKIVSIPEWQAQYRQLEGIESYPNQSVYPETWQELADEVDSFFIPLNNLRLYSRRGDHQNDALIEEMTRLRNEVIDPLMALIQRHIPDEPKELSDDDAFLAAIMEG